MDATKTCRLCQNENLLESAYELPENKEKLQCNVTQIFGVNFNEFIKAEDFSENLDYLEKEKKSRI